MSASTIARDRHVIERAEPDVGASDPRSRSGAPRRNRFSAVEVVFLGAAALAPLDLGLAGSLTVYDVLIAAVAAMLVLQRGRYERTGSLFLPRLLLPATVLFLLAALVSGFRATQPIEALTQTLQFAFIFFVQLPVVFTVVWNRAILHRSIAMLTLGSLVGISISFVLQQTAGAGRIVAFYSDNPNRLGYPIAYLLPFVLHAIHLTWSSGARLRAVALTAVTMYPLLWALSAAGSRGGAVATILSFSTYMVFCEGLTGSVRRVLVATACALSATFVLTSTGLFPSTLEERIDRSVNADEEDRADLLGDREQLAVAATRAISDSPIVGTGLDNFRYVAHRYEARVTDQAPHNLWLSLLAQVGVVGTIAFAFLILTWFEVVLRARSRERDRAQRRLAIAFSSSMLAVMAILMTTPLMLHRQYWLLYGLGMCLILLVPAVAETERGPGGAR